MTGLPSIMADNPVLQSAKHPQNPAQFALLNASKIVNNNKMYTNHIYCA